MKNQNITQNGTVVSRNYDLNGNVTSVQTGTTVSLYDVVTGYSLVVGDKKKPNSFAYETLRDLTYRGRADLFQKAPFYKSSDSLGVFGSRLSDRLPTISWQRTLYYNRALSKLVEKCRGSLDLSVAVAESAETARMLNAVERVRKFLDGVPPSKVGFRWTQPLRELGTRWLEWHLAIKPLIQDVYGSIDEFLRHKVPSLLEINSKAYGQFGDVEVSKLYPNDPKSVAVGSGVQGCYFAIRMKDHGGFDLKRWTSLNPASIAWELLPLSFVADYFYDVGNFLRNLETSLLYQTDFVDGYYTELYSVHYGHREVGPRGDTSTRVYFYDASASYDRTRFFRSVLSSMPLPRAPTFKLPTSWQQLVTLASLLAVKLNPHAKKTQ